MQYNARKQQVIREIYHRAFTAAGLLEPSGRGLIYRRAVTYRPGTISEVLIKAPGPRR